MILHPDDSAVKKLRNTIDSEMLPPYVLPMLQRQCASSNFTVTSSAIEVADQQQYHDAESGEDSDATEDFEHFVEQQTSEYHQMDNQLYTETDGVIKNISVIRNTYYRNFIQRAQEDFMTKQANEHQLRDTIDSTQSISPQSYSKVQNYEERLEQKILLN